MFRQAEGVILCFLKQLHSSVMVIDLFFKICVGCESWILLQRFIHPTPQHQTHLSGQLHAATTLLFGRKNLVQHT